MVHRDLKAENLLLDEEMNIKMLRMSVPGEPGVVSNHLIVFQSSKLQTITILD